METFNSSSKKKRRRRSLLVVVSVTILCCLIGNQLIINLPKSMQQLQSQQQQYEQGESASPIVARRRRRIDDKKKVQVIGATAIATATLLNENDSATKIEVDNSERGTKLSPSNEHKTIDKDNDSANSNKNITKSLSTTKPQSTLIHPNKNNATLPISTATTKSNFSSSDASTNATTRSKEESPFPSDGSLLRDRISKYFYHQFSSPSHIMSTPSKGNTDIKNNNETTTTTTTTIHSNRKNRQHIIRNNTVGWLYRYALWHNEKRSQFPDSQILTHPDAPKVVICYQDGGLGGLTDRMKDIGQLLEYAKIQRRVVFIKWYEAPLDLEAFLEPNLINWTLPYHPENNTTSSAMALREHYGNDKPKTQTQLKNKKIKLLKNARPSMGEYFEPYDVFWNVMFRPSRRVQELLEDAMKDTNHHHRETTTMTTTATESSPPSLSSLQIPKSYDVVHFRIGHPAFDNVLSYNSDQQALDLQRGGGFVGARAIQAIRSAARAIVCAQHLAAKTYYNDNDNNNNTAVFLPLYVYSDSSELVQTIVDSQRWQDDDDNDADAKRPRKRRLLWNTTNIITNLLMANASLSSLRNDLEEALEELSYSTQNYPAPILGRTRVPVVHLEKINKKDRQRNTSQPLPTLSLPSLENDNTNTSSSPSSSSFNAFANTFVDLYIAARARCVSIGVGNYAFLASKISGTSCTTLHTLRNPGVMKRWGMGRALEEVAACPI